MENKKNQVRTLNTRRSFLKSSGALAAGMYLTQPCTARAEGDKKPSGRQGCDRRMEGLGDVALDAQRLGFRTRGGELPHVQAFVASGYREDRAVALADGAAGVPVGIGHFTDVSEQLPAAGE